MRVIEIASTDGDVWTLSGDRDDDMVLTHVLDLPDEAPPRASIPVTRDLISALARMVEREPIPAGQGRLFN